MPRKALSGLMMAVGYLLSPLSWWNDAFVNLPLAYLFSLPFTMISEGLFLPAFLCGYWITNLAGLILLHQGGRGLFFRGAQISLPRQILIALAYTLLVVALVLLGVIKAPASYLR